MLIKSSGYPITNTPGIYPPNFFTVHDSDAKSSDSSADTPVKKYVITRSEYTANKDTRLSFSKGDVIEVVNAEGAWHLGRLVKAQSHPITGEAKKYPSNFVQSVNYNPDTQTVEKY